MSYFPQREDSPLSLSLSSTPTALSEKIAGTLKIKDVLNRVVLWGQTPRLCVFLRHLEENCTHSEHIQTFSCHYVFGIAVNSIYSELGIMSNLEMIGTW